MPILEVKNVIKEFGKLRAVNNVNFGVDQEKIIALIGPNGSGKSTLFHLITGYYPLTAGEIFFKGDRITNLPAFRILEKGISRSFQVANIFPELTAFENVRIGVLAHQKKSMKLFKNMEKLKSVREETLEILKAVGLEVEANSVAGVLSHGDQKCLEIGIALASELDLLILDEPTAGMAPEETMIIVALIKEIAEKRNIKIIFSEHDLKVVFSIAERVIVLHQGSIIADGKGGDIKKNKKVREAYLGEEE